MAKKDAFYFPHDSNAHQDERVLELRAEFGWEGYGIYWALIERMRDTSEYRIRRRAEKAVGMSLGVAPELFEGIIALCLDVGLFEADDDHLWSPALVRRMAEVDEKRKKRQQAGKKGGRASKSTPDPDPEPPPVGDSGKQSSSNAQALLPDSESNAEAKPKQSESNAKQGKERKGKKRKEEENPEGLVDDAREDHEDAEPTPPPTPPPRSRFDPHHRDPDIDEIRSVCAGPNYSVPAADAESIGMHYKSRGWMDTHNRPIRHWPMAIKAAFEYGKRSESKGGGGAPRQPDKRAGGTHSKRSEYQRRSEVAGSAIDVDGIVETLDRFYGPGEDVADHGPVDGTRAPAA